MKKTLSILAVLSVGILSAAQTSADFKAKYDRLTRMLGPSGMGIEYVLEQWEEKLPDDRDMLEAKFRYYLAKSRTTVAVAKDARKYLGKNPIMELTDSTGKKIRYFEDDVFVDSLYAKANDAIEKAIRLYPLELVLRVDRISALTAYEKENPDMAEAETLAWMEMNRKEHPVWLEDGKEADAGAFENYLQNCCYGFYNTGSPASFEAFRRISEKASRYFPKNINFINNLGGYWLVAKNEPKKALKYYEKVLKLSPGNKMAEKNIALAKKKAAEGKGK